MAKILVVEDDALISATVERMLKSESWSVELSSDGDDAEMRLRTFEYDLIILDWQLPGLTGPQICRNFRECGGSTPVLMLTCRDDIDDKGAGFDAGADDYLTKPFHPKELLARVRALLRRPSKLVTNVLSCGDYTVDTKRHVVRRGDQEIALQPMEFALFEFLLRHPGQLFTPEALLKRCWTADVEASVFSLYTCVRRIRKKIDVPGQPSIIVTVPKLGYRLDLPVQNAPEHPQVEQ